MKNSKLRIGFRVDAGNKIGTGHMMEVIAIVKALKRKIAFEPIFITQRDPFTEARLKEHGYDDIFYISENLSESSEARKIVDILKRHSSVHLVTDLPYKSNGFYGYLTKNLKSTFFILDEPEHREIPATVVVNFSITQDRAFYRKAKKYGTRYLIGPAYMPMNGSIKKAKPIKVRRKVMKLFVSQGGSDPYGLAAKILRALEISAITQQVDVVLGGAVKERHRREIDRMKGSLKGNYRFFSNVPQDRLYRLMERADLALSAAGNTLYELAFLGIPTLIVSHHERHDAVAAAFEKRGAAVNMGVGKYLSELQIADVVMRFIRDYPARTSLSRKARHIVNSNEGALIDELVQTVSCG